jgi:glycogen operon protein
MGDEFARTQEGHDNPYDIDSPLTWVDWGRLDEWRPLYRFVQSLVALRRHVGGDLLHGGVRCYGVDVMPDERHESRSLAWATDQLYVMANMWWEPLTFRVHEPGPWRVECSTVAAPAPSLRSGSAGSGELLVGGDTVVVPPRSVTVLAGESVPR